MSYVKVNSQAGPIGLTGYFLRLQLTHLRKPAIMSLEALIESKLWSKLRSYTTAASLTTRRDLVELSRQGEFRHVHIYDHGTVNATLLDSLRSGMGSYVRSGEVRQLIRRHTQLVKEMYPNGVPPFTPTGMGLLPTSLFRDRVENLNILAGDDNE